MLATAVASRHPTQGWRNVVVAHCRKRGTMIHFLPVQGSAGGDRPRIAREPSRTSRIRFLGVKAQIIPAPGPVYLGDGQIIAC
jgi:hypothetical protein